jgi:hypothetical protein
MEEAAENPFQPEKIIEEAKKHLGDIESLVETLDGTVRRLVAERPLAVLGGTLLAGYFAGRILTRKRG